MPKRQGEPPGKPYDRPRKKARLALTADCPSEKIPERNWNAVSLSKIPPEIRNLIYEYVLGGKTIHIATRACPNGARGSWPVKRYHKRSPRPWNDDRSRKFISTICHNPSAEESAYELSKQTAAVSNPVLEGYRDRHARCMRDLSVLQRGDSGAPESFDFPNLRCNEKAIMSRDSHKRQHKPGLYLNLLLACRQIHREAALIPYETNTFSFHDHKDFDLFVSASLNKTQQQALKSIHLNGWLTVPTTTIQLLKGVTHLSLTAYDYMRSRGWCSREQDDFFKFAQLPLQSFRVIVGPNMVQYTIPSQRVVAEKIEHRMMNGQKHLEENPKMDEKDLPWKRKDCR